MRVLHVVNGLGARFGGTAAVVLQMTKALAARPGLTVEIAATDADGAGGHLTDDAKPSAATPVHYFHHDYSQRWKVSLGMRSWLKEQAPAYDLLHVHGLWSFSTASACRAARKAKRPYILFPHGMLSPYTFSRSAGLKKLYWHMIERRNVAKARCLQLTSEAERDEIAHLRLATPTCVIPIGVEPEAWQTPARPEFLKNRLGPQVRGRPIILFLSRLHPKKGVHDFLLPAFAKLKDRAFLAVVGGVDDHSKGYEELVRKEIEILGLQDDVALLGPVDASDRFAAFDGADVFVLPSHHENFGMVVAEAMARKIPAVVSQQVQAGEHVERAEAGRVVPLDASALADALAELLADAPLRSAMGERGRAYVAERLNWTGLAEQLEALYRECVEDPRFAKIGPAAA